MARGVAPRDPARGEWSLDLRFTLKAMFLMGVLYAAYYYPHDPDGAVGRLVAAWLRVQASLAGAVLAALDPSATVQGTVIHGRFPLRIVKSCSALDVQALYLGGVLAFRASWWTRTLGAVVGVVGLSAINVVRIVCLALVGAHAPSLFEAAHEEWLPLVLVACACLGFLAWANWARAVTGRNG